jgi:acetate kinase
VAALIGAMDSAMKPDNTRILTINGGSSSIKFALFEAGDLLQRILEGEIERSGSQGG